MSLVEDEDILVVQGLTFEIQDKVVLRALDLRLRRGEIHSLFGDESLTRASLLKLIAGEYRSYKGSIFFDGHAMRKSSPRRAMKTGIEIIDSSPRVFLNLSVAENVLAERLKVPWAGNVEAKVRRRRIRDFFDSLGVNIDLDAPMSTVYPAERKLVEIARSVCSSPRLLLLDESVIDQLKGTVGEIVVEKLYYSFALLANGGATILSSSNDMDHIFKFAQRVSVLKDGLVDSTMEIKDIDKMQLVEAAYSSILSRSKLEESNFELFYLKQIYEGIFDSMAFPIIVTDSQGKVILVNHGAEKLFKTDKERFYSRPLSEALGVEKGIVWAAEDDLQGMARTQFMRLPDIAPATRVFACPVLDDSDSYLGMLLLFSRPEATFDVAEELKTNSEKFNSEQYVAKFIHEIKNPLGIIINYLQIIRKEKSKEKIGESALHIEHEVERISRLLETPRGKYDNAVHAKARSEKASTIIDDIADVLIRSIAKNEIELNCDFEYDPILPFDPDLIRQVALNLMLNGIEAMPDGGSLNISCTRANEGMREYLVLGFGDTGVGIPKENIDKIFNPFFTTKSDGSSRGIGLSICKEIVETLDGLLHVASVPGEGSNFKVFLPLP